ncbi:MAG TPA: efflux RND transporter periplasmic adaptor subunit [Fimbriimonadaceae bacterium]|nr:efflux RND transporter periplasmic adaptor subunit [Fimbriimonadaceae bacterium]
MRTTNVILMAAAFLAAGCKPSMPRAATAEQGRTVSVPVETIQPVVGPIEFEATGTVRARLNAVLSSKVMGRVVSVEAREGDQVGSGAVLVELDPRELSAGVDVARANLRASQAGVDSARTARDMEAKTSGAKIAQAEATVIQSKAALLAAQSKLDLALAGPRTQEREQAHLAVVQAESSLKLAKINLDRISGLTSQGAMPQKDLDQAQSAYDVALAQRDSAVQAEKIAQEGTRSEDIRSAREGVAQAQAAVSEAEANLAGAKAAALQTRVRTEEVRSAQAQVSQSDAALRSAVVSLAYSTITAPFAGSIVRRAVDPGAMATPGSPLLSIEGGDLRLEASVPESVLPHIVLGETVKARLDAIDRDFQGRVDEIVPDGDPTSHSFIVKLTLSDATGARSALSDLRSRVSDSDRSRSGPAAPRSSICSGMFGRALFVTGHEQRIEAPKTAVWDREGLHYVYALNAQGVARIRIVTIGDPHGDRVTILSGLSAGDRIVASGIESVSDGMTVTPR